jgi:hypothetical protein
MINIAISIARSRARRYAAAQDPGLAVTTLPWDGLTVTLTSGYDLDVASVCKVTSQSRCA